MKRREEFSFLERIYLLEVVRGVKFTTTKLIQNFILHVLHFVGLKTSTPAAASIQYPNND